MVKAIIEIKNFPTVFVFIFFKLSIKIIAPNPYIGQTGPYKNPLLLNTPNVSTQKTVSNIQPKNEYVKKYINNFCFTYL